MSRISAIGLNNTVESDLGASASVNQSLLIQSNQSTNRKYLTQVTVSLVQSLAGFVASNDRYARLIIGTGKVPLTSEEPALASTPFALPSIQGFSRVILSTIVRNELVLDFSTPIEVIEGEILNVFLGAAWTVGDTVTTASISHATLSAIGYETMPNGENNFSYRMK